MANRWAAHSSPLPSDQPRMRTRGARSRRNLHARRGLLPDTDRHLYSLVRRSRCRGLHLAFTPDAVTVRAGSGRGRGAWSLLGARLVPASANSYPRFRMARRAVALAGVIAVLVSLAACGGGKQRTASDRVLRIGDIGEPFSLDPSFAGGAQEAVLASNLMDPLVRLSKDSEAAPNLATSWDMSRDLRKIIFHLSHDGRWTNGDPLTAHDFEWAWKRAMSPELDAPLAYQFYGISGARAYHDCKPKNADCDALRAQVGVTAVDDFTLEVRLNSPQPWFPVQVAHPAFLPVHRATVEKFGKAWTDPENIVTSGPFRLASWRHGASLTLEKNDAWRKADQVALNRVEFRFIPDPETRAQAFESGRLEAARLAGAAPSEMKRFKQTEEFALYAIAGLFYIGINVQNIPD